MITTDDVPQFEPAQAAVLAERHWGVGGSAVALPSERDQNVRIDTPAGGSFVLKIANAAESAEMLDAEAAVMLRLEALGLTPRLVPTLTGDASAVVDGHAVRLVTLLPGRAMASVRRRSPALLESLGATVAHVDRALAGFDHPALRRDFHWDLARAGDVVARHRALVTSPIADTIDLLAARYHELAVPVLDRLPRSVIHNDANDHNVLADARSQQVTGIVDFGDMVHSHTVNDLAIAMAYAALGPGDPIATMGHVARGYDAVAPLTDDELAVLFPLATMRLCVSACLAARQQADRPHDPYLGVSQGPIAATLPALAAVHPRLAWYLLRAACGRPAVPHAPATVARLAALAASGAVSPLVGAERAGSSAYPLDLCAGSPIVSSDHRQNTAERLGQRIADRMAEHRVEFAVGGYGEARLVYASEAYATGSVLDERRTVHLGVDLTAAPGTALYAPLDAVVHAFEHVPDRLDYGPMIVLRHDLGHGEGGDLPPLYSLYGHLSADSLAGLTVGQRIGRGTEFARVGEAPTNGDWWPHVHVQLVTDLLDVGCNVDGACRASRWEAWRSICPDPTALIGVTPLPSETVAGSATSALVNRRRSRIGASVRLSYADQPLHIARGWMQYLYDETGRCYLDAYNNVPHVGHSHPRVVRAVAEQLATLNTNTRYVQHQLLDYADALADRFPDPLSVCFFTASGSEANELALRLARSFTGRRDVVVMDSAYHGHTTTLIDVSPYKHDGPGGRGRPEWVHATPTPDVYRGPHRGADAGARYAADAGAVIDGVADGAGLGAYLAETCPSVGGQLLLPDGFLPDVYRRVRAAGALCIADEVQTGFGRLGTHRWAFEREGVVPDIVVLGKPIANGYPMGAVVTTPDIAAAFDDGMEFFSTFGGSTAACAAALATLQVTEDEALQASALTVGHHLLAAFRELAGRHGLVGDVRGSGLFLGVELVRDRDTREPAGDGAGWIATRLRDLGVLLGTDGPHHNVLKVRGPMPLTVADADLLVAALDQALDEAAQHVG